MAENPAQWGEATKVIDKVMEEFRLNQQRTPLDQKSTRC
jgi:hypothetical protein